METSSAQSRSSGKLPEVQFGFTAQQIIQEGRVNSENISSIRFWLTTQRLPDLTEEQVILFLLCSDNDGERAKITIQRHYYMKNNAPNLFNNRKLTREDLKLQMNTYQFGVLPERTAEGYAIVFCRMKDTNYVNAVMEPSLVLCFMTMEAAFYDYPPNGIIILLDQEGTGLMHLTQMRVGLVKRFLEYIQEGIPVTVKKIHVINTVYFIDKLMRLLKPFIKKESYELLVFHPPNMDLEMFHARWIPKRCLPEEYGGDLPSAAIIHQKNIQKLIEMGSYFDAEEMQRTSLPIK